MKSKKAECTCQQCGKTFRAYKYAGRSKYCSLTCRNLSQQKELKGFEFTCVTCGQVFRRPQQTQVARFCSKNCLAEKRTLEVIESYSAKAGEPIEQWMRRKYIIELWSYRQMCKALGLSQVHTLMKLFDRFGIEPRKGSEAIHAQWVHRGKMSDEERKQRELKKLKHYRSQWPEKARARAAVSTAIRKGELPPLDACKCIKCEEPAKNYHHHRGYESEYWLDVVPVCHKCHYHLENAVS